MNALASIPDQIEAKPVKFRAPSKRLQQALIHLALKGVNQREAAKLSGISEFHLSRELKKPQVQVFIARKRAENIQIAALKASDRVIELVDGESEHVAAKVCLAVLATSGDIKGDSAQVSVNIDIKAGYVIDLTDKHQPMVDVTPGRPEASQSVVK